MKSPPLCRKDEGGRMKDEMNAMLAAASGLQLCPVKSMRVFVAIAVLVLAAVTLCLPSLIAGDTDPIPQRFHVRIGGFMGRSYEVQLQDGSLRYTTFGRGLSSEPVEIRPTMEQWREFRRELDAIGVWRWRAEYSAPGVADGTQWSLDVAYADRAVKTKGSHHYPEGNPDSFGVSSGSKAFTRYLKAVQQLLGGKAFE